MIDPTKKKTLAHFTTGQTAASFTSTSLTPHTKNERAVMEDMEFMFSNIRKKGSLKLHTTLGDIQIILFCDQVSPGT
jgi:peptidyl-prolyl cis-trans isomerase-like protein 2